MTECENNFIQLKNTLHQAGQLAHPDFSRPFLLQTDASNHGLGAVLQQTDATGAERPIAYISRSLTPAEKNYSTTEKEWLAIVWAFTKFHPYLHGTHVNVETDHQPLVHLINKPHPPGRLLRWAMALQEYRYTLTYKKGVQNVIADGLSRVETQCVQFNPTVVQLPTTMAQIAALQQADEQIRQITHDIQSTTSNKVHNHFQLQNNVLYFIQTGKEPRIYIPQSLRNLYMQFFHDHPMSGHLGFHKVLDKIRLRYYWPQMHTTIATYIKQCHSCQQIKPPHSNDGLLQSITISEPFELIGWDIIGPFPESQAGNKYILVISEYLTRWTETAAIPDARAVTIATKLMERIIFPHGCPARILPNQGPQFSGEVLQALATQLGIQQIFTSPYHPQTNGLTERMNKTIKQQLTAFIDPLHTTWDLILPFITHAYNTSVQASTRISPFRALYGRDPRLPPDIKVDLPKKHTRTDAMDWWLHLQQVQPILRMSIHKNLQLAQARQKRCYDKDRQAVEYAIGAKVLVYFPIRRQGLSESMMHRWIGPFTVIRSMRANTYSLRRDANGRITYAHVIRMKPYLLPSTTKSAHEEETHHDDPCEEDSGNPSVAANQQDDAEPPSHTSKQDDAEPPSHTSKQDDAEPPSHTSKRDAFCHSNATAVAPTVKEQRLHQTQSTGSDFFEGGSCGVTW